MPEAGFRRCSADKRFTSLRQLLDAAPLFGKLKKQKKLLLVPRGNRRSHFKCKIDGCVAAAAFGGRARAGKSRRAVV